MDIFNLAKSANSAIEIRRCCEECRDVAYGDPEPWVKAFTELAHKADALDVAEPCAHVTIARALPRIRLSRLFLHLRLYQSIREPAQTAIEILNASDCTQDLSVQLWLLHARAIFARRHRKPESFPRAFKELQSVISMSQELLSKQIHVGSDDIGDKLAWSLSFCQDGLARILIAIGEYPEAIRLIKETIETLEGLASQYHIREADRSLARSYDTMAFALMESSDDMATRLQAKEWAEKVRKIIPSDSPHKSLYDFTYAKTLECTDDPDGALLELDRLSSGKDSFRSKGMDLSEVDSLFELTRLAIVLHSDILKRQPIHAELIKNAENLIRAGRESKASETRKIAFQAEELLCLGRHQKAKAYDCLKARLNEELSTNLTLGRIRTDITDLITEDRKAKHRQSPVQRTNQLLAAIVAQLRTMLASSELGFTLETYLEAVRSTFGVSAAGITLFDPELQELQAVAGVGFWDTEAYCRSVESYFARETEISDLAENSQVDIKAIEAVSGSKEFMWSREQFQAARIVPLIAGDTFLGTMELYDRKFANDPSHLSSIPKGELQMFADNASAVLLAGLSVKKLRRKEMELREA